MPTPDSRRGTGFSLPLPVRIGGALLLIGVLFWATLHNELLYRLFGGFWQRTFALLGVSQQVPAIMHSGGALGQVTNQPRDIPAVLSYSVLYVGICLSLLFLLLPRRSQHRLVLLAYGAAGVAFIGLLVIGKLGSSASLTLSNQLIHFIVSPMPVIVLAPLLQWNARLKRPAKPAGG